MELSKPMMGPRVDPEIMRRAMRRWATGVTVVTSAYEGMRHGMTVSSFTSIDVEPPLVLVSLENKTRTHAVVLKSGVFGVTILGSQQQDISELFAGRRTDQQDRFEGIRTETLVTGAPMIGGGLAWLDCRVVSMLEAGFHTVFIGEVVAVDLGSAPGALLYYERTYLPISDGTGA